MHTSPCRSNGEALYQNLSLLVMEFVRVVFCHLSFLMSIWMTCLNSNTLTNHLMYADDLVIICPYSAGLQQLLKVCSQYGADFNIKYNASKSNVMIVRTKEDRNLVFPVFFLSGTALKVCEEIKYLGHHIANDLSDDKDINRQCRKIYGQANVLVRKFGMCSAYVKVALFKAFCTPLYTAHLWRSYSKKNMQRLIVAYNDGMRLLLKQPRWSSASQMFVNVGVPTCTALIRNETLAHLFVHCK